MSADPAQHEIESALEVADIAEELVSLWEDQNIAGLPRAQRNSAIDGTRMKLIKAVNEWRSTRSAMRGAEGRAP